MNNLTTNQKKQILSQLITNKVKENKSIIEFIGISLDSINYAQIVANMLINNSRLSREIIDLLDSNNPFSKKVRAIQYA
tara:strand:+ start:162 stop:398 length:237 start_codon:yes stop_codon:yes gene_type:complete